jgi:hypothetical protein
MAAEDVRGCGPAGPGQDDGASGEDVRHVENARDERAGDEPELDGDREPRGGGVREAPVFAELRNDRGRREPRRHREDERNGEEGERPAAA